MGAILWQKVTTSNTTGGGVQMGSYPYLKKFRRRSKTNEGAKRTFQNDSRRMEYFFAGH